MIRFQPFVANVATCGGVGTGWVWNVKVYVADGVSTQTFTVAVNGTTVATLTGSESYGPFRVVGPDTLTVTANSASDTQVVTLDGNVVYTNPPDITDPEQGLVAPLTLPAESGKPLTTQGGNTLDDGSGDATIKGTLSAPGLLTKVATTGTAGVALINGNLTILTWTAPNDGKTHTVFIAASITVTAAETGGQCNVNGTSPGGAYGTLFFSSSQAAATYPAQGTQVYVVGPGDTLSLAQVSALTAGAATVYGEMWAD